MKAVMLAAGIGARLEKGPDFPPKVLMRFGGKSLLQRHVEILRFLGVRELVLGVGYRAETVEQEIAALDAGDFTRTVMNSDFRLGPITTLWSLCDEIAGGEPIIFMDGDVLYDHRILARLLDSPHDNCFLLDRNIEPGDEPVKLCIRDGRLVDFHKRPTEPHDQVGEWIGFLKLSPDIAQRLPAATQAYIDRGATDSIYELAFRDLLLTLPPDTFGIEDITGLPWIEIDFPEDIQLAAREILPKLEGLPG